MENGSISPTLLCVSVEARDDRYLRGQTPFSSVGDGWGHMVSRDAQMQPHDFGGVVGR